MQCVIEGKSMRWKVRYTKEEKINTCHKMQKKRYYHFQYKDIDNKDRDTKIIK